MKRQKPGTRRKRELPKKAFLSAVETRDAHAVHAMTGPYRQRVVETTAGSRLKTAIADGDIGTCVFLRETTSISFKDVHFKRALRTSNLSIIEWIWSQADEREKDRFSSHANFILAVTRGFESVAGSIQDRRNFPPHKKAANKTLSDYAVMTGDPEKIDLALSFFPEEVAPNLYITALLASTKSYNSDFPRLKDPVKIIDYLKEKQVDPRPALPGVARFMFGSKPNKSARAAAHHLKDIIFDGTPCDKDSLFELIRVKGLHDDGVEQAFQLLSEMFLFEEINLDLDDLATRIKDVRDPRINNILCDFLDFIQHEYFHEVTAGELEDDDWDDFHKMVVSL